MFHLYIFFFTVNKNVTEPVLSQNNLSDNTSKSEVADVKPNTCQESDQNDIPTTLNDKEATDNILTSNSTNLLDITNLVSIHYI